MPGPPGGDVTSHFTPCASTLSQTDLDYLWPTLQPIRTNYTNFFSLKFQLVRLRILCLSLHLQHYPPGQGSCSHSILFLKWKPDFATTWPQMLGLSTSLSPRLVAQFLSTSTSSSLILLLNARGSGNTELSALLCTDLPVMTSMPLFLLASLSETALPLFPHSTPTWLIHKSE